MRHKLTDNGVVLPKDWFRGASEVDIRREDDRVIVVPVQELDPILGLGESPVDDDLTDASEKHDQYLYDDA